MKSTLGYSYFFHNFLACLLAVLWQQERNEEFGSLMGGLEQVVFLDAETVASIQKLASGEGLAGGQRLI